MSDKRKAEETVAHGLKIKDVKLPVAVFMVFSLCAGGAYGVEEIIPESGPGLTLLLLIVVPIIWSIPLGLVSSELGSARPEEGGYYKWVQEAFGEYWGFQAGWWRTISIYIDNTLYVILAGGYLANGFGLSGTWEIIFKFAVIIVFTYINIRGAKDVGMVTSIMSALVIIAFALVTLCGFLNWQSDPFLPFTAAGDVPASEIPFKDMVYYGGSGLALTMWMYSGYESMSTMAGEIKNPQLIPKATMIAIPVIIAIYILPTMSGLASVGRWEEWGTDIGTIGYHTPAMEYWGTGFGIFFVVVAIIAQCAIYNTYMASGTRGFFALADDYLAPPFLVRCDKKYGVPYNAVISMAVVNMILCMFSFKVVVVVDVFLLISAYIMIFFAAIKLRKKIPKEEYKFRIPGGQGLFVAMCVVPVIVTFAAFFINGTDYFIGGMVGIISGPVMYIIWKKKYGGLSRKYPELYPIDEKTGLAKGDLKRMSFNALLIAVMGFIAVPWLRWFEGGWGPEYYAETYDSGVTKVLFGNFDGMINAILIAAVLFAVGAAVLYLLHLRWNRTDKL